MKKTIFSAIICCLCAVVYLSAASVKNTQPAVNITATCSNASFDEELEKALASLKKGQALTVKQDGENYTFTVGDGGTGPSEIVRCTGGGMKFAKCAKAAIDEHGCQKISSTGGGNYKSEDC
jgi:hypothetical protein